MIILFLVILVLILLAVLFLKYSYFIVPSSQEVIIQGLGVSRRYSDGQSGFYIPFLQKKFEISLVDRGLTISTDNEQIVTKDNQIVDVDAYFLVAIDTTSSESLRNFLGQDSEKVFDTAQEILKGIVRQGIGGQVLNDIVHRSSLADALKPDAEKALKALGLKVKECVIKDVVDSNDVIATQGKPLQIEVEKQNAISKAKADEEANAARVEADCNIAKQNADYFENQQEQQRRIDFSRAQTTLQFLSNEEAIAEKELIVSELKIKGERLVPAMVESEAQRLEADATEYSIIKVADAKNQRGQGEMFEMTLDAMPSIFSSVKMPDNMTVISGNEEGGNLPIAQGLAAANAITEVTLGDNIKGILSSFGSGK